MKLTDDDRKFLGALKPDGSPTGSWLLPLATRASDRARTRAKKYGWASFDRKVWAWRITEAGRSALKEQDNG
jgi:hypothetical protein